MLVYFPVKDKNGWNVVMVPSEQLVIIMNKMIQKVPGRRGYVTDRYYEFDYMFKTSEAAWRFIKGEATTEDDVYSKIDVFPNKEWSIKHLPMKDRDRYKKMKEERDKKRWEEYYDNNKNTES